MATRETMPLLLSFACLLNSFAEDAPKKPAPTAAQLEKAKADIPGLTLHLKLDEKEGNKAANSVEKGVSVDVTGGKWTTDGKFDGALSFNGESDYALTATSVHQAFTGGDITIAVWIKPSAGGVVIDELGQHELEGGWHDSQIEVMNDGEVKVRVWPLESISIGKIKLDEWHHVVLRYSKIDALLEGFIDGIPSENTCGGEKQWNGGGEIYYAFGAKDSTNTGHGGFFKGLMDDIRIYNRALTDNEIDLLAGVTDHSHRHSRGLTITDPEF
jgi:hypothetical protein